MLHEELVYKNYGCDALPFLESRLGAVHVPLQFKLPMHRNHVHKVFPHWMSDWPTRLCSGGVGELLLCIAD